MIIIVLNELISDVFLRSPTHGHTHKDLHSEPLRGYWMPSRGYTESGSRDIYIYTMYVHIYIYTERERERGREKERMSQENRCLQHDLMMIINDKIMLSLVSQKISSYFEKERFEWIFFYWWYNIFIYINIRKILFKLVN